MMNRQNQILTVILVIQIALGAALFWPRTVAGTESGPLLAEFKAADVVELAISDVDGNRVELAKRGDDWVLPGADDFPADGEKITPILEKVEGVQTNRLVTQTEASHQRLQVAADDFNRRLELTLADGSSHTLYVGSSGGASATHVRADDAPEVFLTGELNSWEVNAQASAWIDTLYFSLPTTATVALKLENANGTFEFVKAEDDTWTMAGLAEDEVLKESEVTRIVNSASSVRLTEPIGKEEQASFGLSDPSAVVTLTTEDASYTLRVGAQDPADNSYVLSSSESPYYVRVAQFTGETFANATRENFLEPPPTQEAEETDPSGS